MNESDHIIEQMLLFIKGKYRNIWLLSDNIKVYVRKSERNVNGRYHTAFDIASIELDETIRGKGIGTSLINRIHETHPFEITFMENVLNKGLGTWVNKNGWAQYKLDDCYYKSK